MDISGNIILVREKAKALGNLQRSLLGALAPTKATKARGEIYDNATTPCKKDCVDDGVCVTHTPFIDAMRLSTYHSLYGHRRTMQLMARRLRRPIAHTHRCAAPG